jgi:tetratricopeptide (TPR) repeat protein
LQSRHQEAQSASEQALVYYLRSGWSPSGCLVGLAASLYYGPVRVPDAVARCNELLEGTSERVAKAHVLVFLGGLVALDGRIDDGRNLVEEASAIYAELGEAYARANNGGRILGDIELLAGDYLAAETALREACALFEQAHDQAALSSVSSTLAQALYARGRILEAKEVADTARDSAPRDDVPARIAWRAVSAKLLAREGALHDAEALVREAVALSESTDSPCQRANVLMDLAEVKRLAEDMDEAATAVGRALRLFEQKGDVISAERARGLLDEHAIA